MGAFRPGRSRTGNGITTLRRVPWRFAPTQKEGTPSGGAHKISLPVKEPTPVLAALALSTFFLASYAGGVIVSRETTAGSTPFGREFIETSGQPAPTQGPKYNGRVSANFHVPPTVTSLNYTVGDTQGGGQNVVITGTRLAGAIAVTFGRVFAKIVGNTSTTVTVQVPAHEKGVVDVIVTTATEGPSVGGENIFEYWTPAQIANIVAYLDAAKGVDIGSATDVAVWNDQSANAWWFGQSSGTERPALVPSAFGTMPALRFVPASWLDYAGVPGGAPLLQLAGRSVFWVGKWTSATAASSDYPGNVAQVILGDTSGGVMCSAGVAGGKIAYSAYPTHFADPWVSMGSGLNAGFALLCGFTHTTSGVVEGFVGATSQGTVGSVTYDTSNTGFNCIGGGQPAVSGAGDTYDGDLGAVIVVSGIIASGDRTKLNNWAKQRFGTL